MNHRDHAGTDAPVSDGDATWLFPAALVVAVVMVAVALLVGG